MNADLLGLDHLDQSTGGLNDGVACRRSGGENVGLTRWLVHKHSRQVLEFSAIINRHPFKIREAQR